MNYSKYFIFLLFVLFECHNGALARRLNPIGYFPSKNPLKLDVSLSKSADQLTEENDLKLGIIDHDPKGTGQEGFEVEEKVGMTAHKIMEDLKKLICKIAYPRPCGNLQLEITSSDESKYEEKRQTTVKPRPKPAEKNKNNIYFRLRTMKR